MSDSSRELLSGSRRRLELFTKKQRGSQDQPPHDATDSSNHSGILQDHDQPTKQPMNAQLAQSLAEQRISAAMRDGQFDNLDGMGKPLDLYDDAHVPTDMRMAFRMMKGKNMGLPWADAMAQYKTQYYQYITWLNNNRREWEYGSEHHHARLLDELGDKITALNNVIHTINATVPNDSMRLGLLVLKLEQAKLTGEGAD